MDNHNYALGEQVVETATGRIRTVTAIVGVGPKRGPVALQFAWQLNHTDWIISRDAIRPAA